MGISLMKSSRLLGETSNRQPTEGKTMDFLNSLLLIAILVVVPIVAGMAMGYGLEEDRDEQR